MYVDFDVRDRILIVGSGAAGLSAATELRRLGFAGELVVMGDEPEGHYDRPACSKGILSGHKRPSDVITPLDPDLDVIWRLGRRAVSCDLDRRVVEAHTGETVFFDGLIIASGCRPVVPNDWPDDQPGMHVLHGLSAAWELRRELRAARRVAVVGGGVTGCEVACAVKDLARQAVIIEPRPFVMGRAVGSIVGHMVAASHRRAGIEIASGGRVKDVDYRNNRWHLTLKDGSTVDADLVVATMGERPDVAWLEGTGIDTSDGVLCDESLRVITTAGTAVEGVVACGSLARWPNPRGNGKPTKTGQWIAAQEQGQGAARTLLAGGRPVPAVSILPRYWSHQLGLRIEVCGELDPKADIEVHEMRPGKKDVAKNGVLATYTRNGRLIGSVAVNAPRLFTNTARMMRLDEPSVTVLPPLPTPVSPGVGPLERPVERLAIGAAPEPMSSVPRSGQPALPAGPSSDPAYGPAYTGPEPTYGPEPGYALEPAYGRGYGQEPGYGPVYGPEPGYGPAYGPEPGYGPDPGYGPGPGYGPEPAYAYDQQPAYAYDQQPAYAYDQQPAYAYGPEPAYDTKPAYGPRPPRGPQPAYGPEPAYGQDYGGGRSYDGQSYEGQGYGRGPTSGPGYQQANGYGPDGYGPDAYNRDGYGPSGSGPDGYERGYERGYGPTSGYGHERGHQGGYERGHQGGYERGHERGYGPPAYDPGYDARYGNRDYEAYDERNLPVPASAGYGPAAYNHHHGAGPAEPVYGAEYGGHPLVQEYAYGKTRGFGPPPRSANGPAAGSGYGPTSGPGYGAGASDSGYDRAAADPGHTPGYVPRRYAPPRPRTPGYDAADYDQGYAPSPHDGYWQPRLAHVS